ncbi:MAG: glycoside hydrolase family 3 N-terminal domain-containing protein, partial [Nakamurella sp.]
MSTAQQAGSVIMPVDSQADGKIAENHYGGVILQGEQGVVDGTKVGDPSQVKSVVAGLQKQRDGAVPMLIGVDQEYGEVARLVNGFTDFPGASTLAAGSNTDTAVALAEQVAVAASREMLVVGITVDFAPGADVLPTTGESAIGSRSYGTDPQRVAKFVAAAVRGYQSGGVAATIKHFPGIGRIAADTHNQLPSLKADCDDWSSTEAVP